MEKHLITTKQLEGVRVVDAKRGKRIGKVRRFVFHPTQRQVVGFMVKRPDAALMFHRKDMFVALDGYDMVDGQVVVRDEAQATDRGAVRALGVDWDACVIWVGMPVITESGQMLGYVGAVTFDEASGQVESLVCEQGAASDALLGKRVVPGKLVRGFRRGQGVPLASVADYKGEDVSEDLDDSMRGAILVDDEAAELSQDGGLAAAAGKASAVAADKAKAGVAKARASVDEGARRAKPVAREAARKTEKAVEAGSYAVGKQLGKASGMFAAFKEEFDKAAHGDGDE